MKKIVNLFNSYFVSVFPENGNNLFTDRGRTEIFRNTYKFEMDKDLKIYFKWVSHLATYAYVCLDINLLSNAMSRKTSLKDKCVEKCTIIFRGKLMVILNMFFCLLIFHKNYIMNMYYFWFFKSFIKQHLLKRWICEPPSSLLTGS